MASTTTFRGLPCPTLVVLLVTGLRYKTCVLQHVYPFPLASWSVLGQNSLFQVLSEWVIIKQSSITSRPVCTSTKVVSIWPKALKFHVLKRDRIQFSSSGEDAR